MRITPIHYKKLAKVIELAGGRFIRNGRHDYYWINGCKRPISIPRYKKVPVFIIMNCLRNANIDRDKYFKLLKKV